MILEGFLPGNLGISCYKKLGRGARCVKGENGPLTAKKSPHEARGQNDHVTSL